MGNPRGKTGISGRVLRVRATLVLLLGLIVAAPAIAQDDRAVSAEAIVERLSTAIGNTMATRESLPEGVRFLVRFSDDVGGLDVGSPVTVRGRRVGTVREVAVVIDTNQGSIDVPVVIDVVPARISVDGAEAEAVDEAAFYTLAERLVGKGLRAALESTTLLGGEQRVALAFAPDAKPAILDRAGRYPELPAAPSLTDRLRSTVEKLVARLATLPLEQLVGEATATVVDLRALVTGPEIRQIIENLHTASNELRTLVAGPELRAILAAVGEAGHELQSVVANLDTRLDPSINAMQRAAESVEVAAGETRDAMTGLQGTVGPRSPLWDELLQTSRELSGTTRALRLLVEYLERYPDALLRGRPEIQP